MSFALRTRVALLALAAAYFTMGTASLSVVALVQPMTSDLGVSPAAIANLVTVFALTFAVAAPSIQIVLGRFPRRTLLLGGLALMSVAGVAGALASSYPLVLASRMCLGLGAATVGPMCSALGAGMVPLERQGRALTLVFSGMILATVLGLPLSGWLGNLTSWRVVFAAIAALSAIVAIAVGILVRDRSSGGVVTPAVLMRVLGRPRARLAVLTALFQMAAQFATYALVIPFLIEFAGMSGDAAIGVLFVFGVGGVIGNLLAGRLGDALGADRTVRLSLIGLAASYAGLLLCAGRPSLATVVALIWAVAGTLFYAPQQQRLVAIDLERRSILLALNASALYIGMSLGSFIAGIAYHRLGAAPLPVASLLLLALAGWAFGASRRAGP